MCSETQQPSKPESEIKKAMLTLEKAFKEQPDYAHGWHCNIAMACFGSMTDTDGDQAHNHQVSNKAASAFMKNCFNVTTSDDMLENKDAQS